MPNEIANLNQSMCVLDEFRCAMPCSRRGRSYEEIVGGSANITFPGDNPGDFPDDGIVTNRICWARSGPFFAFRWVFFFLFFFFFLLKSYNVDVSWSTLVNLIEKSSWKQQLSFYLIFHVIQLADLIRRVVSYLLFQWI